MTETCKLYSQLYVQLYHTRLYNNSKALQGGEGYKLYTLIDSYLSLCLKQSSCVHSFIHTLMLVMVCSTYLLYIEIQMGRECKNGHNSQRLKWYSMTTLNVFDDKQTPYLYIGYQLFGDFMFLSASPARIFDHDYDYDLIQDKGNVCKPAQYIVTLLLYN